jgi:methionyl-tRNA synthetase
VGRYNSDLANGLGNLASRTLAMINQYRGGVIPASDGNQQIAQTALECTAVALESYDKFEFSKALEATWSLIGAVDKYIVNQAPWKLAKAGDAESKRLDEVLYTAAEALRIVTALLGPVLPESATKIWMQLGFTTPLDHLKTAALHWGHLKGGQSLGAVSTVFPRADVKASIEKMMELEKLEVARQLELLGKKPEPDAVSAAPAGAAAAPVGSANITIDDFAKVDLRVGVVKDAAVVKGSDKLLHLHVDIGEAQPRSIVAGIALAYKPEALVGRKVVIVANLAPRKLRGIESQGMIVAASRDGDIPVLASFLEDVPVGARLK